MRKSDFSLLSV